MDRPLPPEALAYRVSGTQNLEWFDRSGKLTLDLYAKGLTELNRTFTEFTDIYDWGCGCGRVLRWLLDEAPQARLFGSDIDEAAIEWLRVNYPQLDARVNGGLPPLPFHNTTFDLVLGYSVFTHLDEAYQDAWLTEMHRMTRPGASLLLTISSNLMWDHTMTTSDHPRLYELRAMRERLDKEGIIFWTGDGWEHHFPEFYHTTFHTHDYVHRHWSQWFDIIAIQAGSVEMPQDIVVARRRA